MTRRNRWICLAVAVFAVLALWAVELTPDEVYRAIGLRVMKQVPW